ncbi:hypothetical protein [Jeotgalibacillus sp. R-1-5s-1]|uniref:hypothetical protein n=1 Tax=Jeotgalibacillus sp. R-1-5s-1 TaxID=2555897 RepID=UPI00106AB997|nr:hypothetical protein [Jeotgalibacillus sp. R-1-5s-1]TFD97688.1 hypothetical protein E2491_09725 [Jeotgalibacillus sp. R-1-5s-1]
MKLNSVIKTIRLMMLIILIPLFVLLPDSVKAALYVLPLLILLSVSHLLLGEKPKHAKLRLYVLITCMYLIGVLAEQSLIRFIAAIAVIYALLAAEYT